MNDPHDQIVFPYNLSFLSTAIHNYFFGNVFQFIFGFTFTNLGCSKKENNICKHVTENMKCIDVSNAATKTC